MSRRAALLITLLLPLMHACKGPRYVPYPGDRSRPISEARAVQTQTIAAENLRVLRREPVRTDVNQFKVIRVFFRGSGLLNYDVLLGPDSEGFMEDGPSASFVLNYGWVYATGQWPRVSNGEVTAGADGSAIAMQAFKTDHKTYPGVRRVFFFSGTSAWINVITASGTTNISLFDPKQYVEVSKDGNAQRLALPATGDVRTDHDDIQAAGAAALGQK